jgi:hypothetical protein
VKLKDRDIVGTVFKIIDVSEVPYLYGHFGNNFMLIKRELVEENEDIESLNRGVW